MLTRLYKAIKEAVKGKPLKLRSPRWDDVRKIHLKSFPACAACGSETNLQVHHIKPFHLYPELELDEENLITLCETKAHKCHFKIGHLNNWRRENPNVAEDAVEYSTKNQNALENIPKAP